MDQNRHKREDLINITWPFKYMWESKAEGNKVCPMNKHFPKKKQNRRRREDQNEVEERSGALGIRTPSRPRA